MSELRSHGNLSQQLRRDPLRHLRALEAACHEIAQDQRPGYDKTGSKIKVALSGPIGASPLSPRGLNSSMLRQLVQVEGVATKVSSIKPKVVKSVHYCQETNQHSEKSYVDATDPELGLHAIDSSGREQPDRIINITPSVYPTKDKDGNPLETEFGLSVYKDHQTVFERTHHCYLVCTSLTCCDLSNFLPTHGHSHSKRSHLLWERRGMAAPYCDMAR